MITVKKNNSDLQGHKMISFGKLVFEALPEMWTFQLPMGILLVGLSELLDRLIIWVTSGPGGAMTTASLRAMILNWRFPVVLALGAILVLAYIVVELFAKIHMAKDILYGNQASFIRELGAGIRSLRLFFNPGGIGILVFIFLAVPLCGVGFSISLTKNFYLPNFIMDVIMKTPLLLIGYFAGMVFLVWFGFRSMFTLHGVLIDGLSPSQARKKSIEIIQANWKCFLLWAVRMLLLIFFILAAAYFLFVLLPEEWLNRLGADVPIGYQIDLRDGRLDPSMWSATEAMVIRYRVFCCAAVLMGYYLSSVVFLLWGAYIMLRFTRLYLALTGRDQKLWPERPKKARYRFKVLASIGVFLGVLVVSACLGLVFNQVFDRAKPVKIIAHRTGGNLASENSIEGLYAAIEHGCYGSETDVQRTADGYYIAYHDNDFKRLTGVARTPQKMTMEEIRQLAIRDTTGSGKLLPVPTLEEMLDVIKSHKILFIELKGATADRRMVDDVVQMIREHDCVEDVALISLNYPVIDYAESSYPEFVTGTLFFGAFGDVSRMNCDLLIMEEETASPNRVNQVHAAGKEVIVWTVNTEQAMLTFLDSGIDAVITDEIEMADAVQDRLDKRTDLQLLRSRLDDIWGNQ